MNGVDRAVAVSPLRRAVLAQLLGVGVLLVAATLPAVLSLAVSVPGLLAFAAATVWIVHHDGAAPTDTVTTVDARRHGC